MKAPDVEVNIDETPLVSIDGIGEFTSRLGTFFRGFRQDAQPLIEYGERAELWIKTLRERFGTRLRHVAVASKYRYRQFPEFPEIPALCVDDTYCHITIDDESLVTKVEKRENDATTSEELMAEIRKMISMVLIGVTTTTCIEITVKKLLGMMRREEIQLQQIIMARDGVASRKSRQKNERSILDAFEREPRIIVVPRLEDIHFT